MDGLEWMRSKYNKPVKRFLKLAEKWAAMQSHLLIADHLEIETYLRQHYFNQVVFIPYGAEILKEKEPDVLAKFNLTQKKYNLVIARFEPENHIEEIIDGHKLSGVEYPLVLVGSYKNRFGSHLKRHNPGNKNIIFLGPIYDKQTLNALRSHAHFYFHGHSVGGTNPSLLEAMACGCNIVAHKNPYNKGVLASNGTYFNNAEEIATQLQTRFIKTTWQGRARKNTSAIRDKYNWQIVIEQYELAMKQLLI
jgi:glycosyltransferase involved in cell wall biosynthesis